MTNKKDYGKLANGQIEYPPLIFVENGNSTIWYDEEFLLNHGYKKIVQTEPPDNGMEYTPVYAETKDAITLTWK